MPATIQWERSDIEVMPPADRPKVRCRYPAVYVDQDGQREHVNRDTEGKIIVDGNNPWVVIWAGGSSREFRVSWGLLLEVLNDPYAAPIDGFQPVEYER